MKKNVSRVLRCLFTIIAFVTILSACNSRFGDRKGNYEEVLLKKDFSVVSNAENNMFYSTQELTFDFELDCNYPSMSQMTVCGDKLAVLVNGVDEEFRLWMWVYYFNENGDETGHFNLDDALDQAEFSTSWFIGFTNGELAVCSEYNSSANVFFLDQQGNQTRNPLVIDYENENIYDVTGMQALSNGDIAVFGKGLEGSKLIVYDAEQKQKFNIVHKEDIKEVLESGNKLYIFYNSSNQNGEIIDWLEEIDSENGNSKKKIDISELGKSGNKFCINGQIYSSNQTDLIKIDLDQREIKTLLRWGETDVDRSVYNQISPISILTEETLFILGLNRNEFQNNSVLMLKQQTGDPFEGSTTLTLGGFDIANCDYLQQAVSQFNQSNDFYRIQIVDYFEGIDYGQQWDAVLIDQKNAEQQMLLDTLSGKGPDILYSWGGGTSFAQYERNKLLVDLYPLISADLSFDIESLIPNVVSACENDGKLFKLTPHFSIEGLFGKPSIIQDRQKWTIDEFNMVASTLPDGVRMFTNRTSEELLEANLAGSLQYFINDLSNTASFDSAEFCQVLEWAKSFGQKIQMSPDGRLYEDEWDLFDRNLLMFVTQARVNSFNPFYPMNIIDERANFIGYPSPGQYKAYIVPEEIIAISSWSKSPEGSWEFIKYLLSYDYQFDYSSHDYFWDRGGLGYPINQRALDEWCNLELNPELQPVDPNEPAGDGTIDETQVTQKDSEQIKEETQKRLDTCLELIYSANVLYYPDAEIINIIMEESTYYFAGEKAVEDVVEIIQDRVQTLLNE